MKKQAALFLIPLILCFSKLAFADWQAGVGARALIATDDEVRYWSGTVELAALNYEQQTTYARSIPFRHGPRIGLGARATMPSPYPENNKASWSPTATLGYSFITGSKITWFRWCGRMRRPRNVFLAEPGLNLLLTPESVGGELTFRFGLGVLGQPDRRGGLQAALSPALSIGYLRTEVHQGMKEVDTLFVGASVGGLYLL